jgi:AcrR family transcriptional regulator
VSDEAAGGLAAAEPAANARERILEAAVRRIASEGMDDARIARIATDAGVSPALVHYHFESREMLLAEALQYSYDLLGEERVGDADLAPSGAAGRLRSMLESFLPLPGDQRRDWLLWVELWLRGMRSPELRPTSAWLYADMHDWIRAVVTDAIAAGEARPCDPDDFADRLLALIDGCGVRTLIGDPGMPLERMRELVWSFVVAELGLDAAAPAAEEVR